MIRTTLFATGLWALTLTTGAAHADDLPADLLNQSPDQAAISDAITQQLIGEMTEAGLWTRLVNRPRGYNQRLYVSVPAHAITLGKVLFDDTVRFQVTHDTQWIENCNGTQPLSQTIETTTEVTNSYYNTRASNAQSTLSHTVTLDAKVGSSLGSYVEASYSFNKTESTSEDSTTQDTRSNDQMVKETLTLSANPHESVAYQTNQVLLTGNQSTFIAHASVNTTLPLHFYIQTIGTQMPDVGVKGTYVSVLNNAPVPGKALAAQDLHLGTQVLRSADGSFVFGLESGRGAYSVIDLNASQPAQPYRLWTPTQSQTCSRSPDFVMTADGQLQVRCNGAITWRSSNSARTGNPCYYLMFSPSAPGELVCYSAPPEANGMISYLSGTVAIRNLGEEIKPGLRRVKMALADLVQIKGNTLDVSFTGRFDGQMRVMGPTHCLISYESGPDARTNRCKLKGMKSLGSTKDTSKGVIKSKTPSGEVAQLSYCGPTNAFLQPYLARNPYAVGGN